MKNIVLIGMMGCGKSTCGRLLAKRLGRTLVDTDEWIVEKEGRSIADIFAAEGEEYFRTLERDASRELALRQGLVIACGGGLPTRRESIEALKSSGVVVFLDRDPAEIFDSVSMAGRPLGQAGKEAFLERYRQREPVYRSWADWVISSGAAPEETVTAILEVVK